MNVIIVPSHNQSKHIINIIKGYEQQEVLPNVVLFVFDRCEDDSIEVISSYNSSLDVRYIIKSIGENFSAGMTRDFGVDYILENIPNYNMIVFTDGDCVPSKDLVKEHLENMNTKKALVSCGRRMCEDEEGNWIDDERNIGSWVNGFGFHKNGRVLLSKKVTIENILSYSCNFAFNKKAIDLCRQINYKLSNMCRVFNPNFDGSWGGEDNFISHCLYLTNNWIVMTSNQCYVNHYHHKESVKDIRHKNQILRELSERLTTLIYNGEVEGTITKFKKNTNLRIPMNGMSSLKYYGDSLPSYNIEHKYNKDTFDACYNFLYSRVCVFEGYCDKRVISKDVEEILEFLTYIKFYLKDDELVFENDIACFIPKNSVVRSSYSK